MINAAKKKIRSLLHPTITYFRKLYFENKLSTSRKKNIPIKVVIGSSGIFNNDWIPSEREFLNLLKEDTWSTYFKTDEIDCMFAEHVWEHLTRDQGLQAAQTCFKYLAKNGCLRIAVPDGFHVDPKYIDYVKPGGSGNGADDHKILYNYKTFTTLLEECGFQVKLLEYFDENQVFHQNEWTSDHGNVRRSLHNDERNTGGKPNYTSLIIDAIKI